MQVASRDARFRVLEHPDDLVVGESPFMGSSMEKPKLISWFNYQEAGQGVSISIYRC